MRATALDGSLVDGKEYQCPSHPFTGQRYRWAASAEVRLRPNKIYIYIYLYVYVYMYIYAYTYYISYICI